MLSTSIVRIIVSDNWFIVQIIMKSFKSTAWLLPKMGLITFDPVYHTYIQLGKNVGKAFSDGKQLK